MFKFEIETFVRLPDLPNISLVHPVYVWANSPADAREAAIITIQNDTDDDRAEVTAGRALNLGPHAQ